VNQKNHNNMTDLSKEHPRDIVKSAERNARQYVSDGVKTHQLRNFFSAIEKMRKTFNDSGEFEKIEADLHLLKPKLAYAAGRQPNSVGRSFYSDMITAIDAVVGEGVEDNKEATKNFFAYIESILAYHKFIEKTGKNK